MESGYEVPCVEAIDRKDAGDGPSLLNCHDRYFETKAAHSADLLDQVFGRSISND